MIEKGQPVPTDGETIAKAGYEEFVNAGQQHAPAPTEAPEQSQQGAQQAPEQGNQGDGEQSGGLVLF